MHLSRVCVHLSRVCVHLSRVCVHLSRVCVHLSRVCVHLSRVCVHLSRVCVHLSIVCVHLSIVCVHLSRVCVHLSRVCVHLSRLCLIHFAYVFIWNFSTQFTFYLESLSSLCYTKHYIIILEGSSPIMPVTLASWVAQLHEHLHLHWQNPYSWSHCIWIPCAALTHQFHDF